MVCDYGKAVGIVLGLFVPLALQGCLPQSQQSSVDVDARRQRGQWKEGDKGTETCEEGTSAIIDEEECRDAIEKLRRIWEDTEANSGSCFSESGKGYFGSEPLKNKNKRRPVCKSATKTTVADEKQATAEDVIKNHLSAYAQLGARSEAVDYTSYRNSFNEDFTVEDPVGSVPISNDKDKLETEKSTSRTILYPDGFDIDVRHVIVAEDQRQGAALLTWTRGEGGHLMKIIDTFEIEEGKVRDLKAYWRGEDEPFYGVFAPVRAYLSAFEKLGEHFKEAFVGETNPFGDWTNMFRVGYEETDAYFDMFSSKGFTVSNGSTTVTDKTGLEEQIKSLRQHAPGKWTIRYDDEEDIISTRDESKAAVYFTLTIEGKDGNIDIAMINTFEFDEHAKVVGLKAYGNPQKLDKNI